MNLKSKGDASESLLTMSPIVTSGHMLENTVVSFNFIVLFIFLGNSRMAKKEVCHVSLLIHPVLWRASHSAWKQHLASIRKTFWGGGEHENDVGI